MGLSTAIMWSTGTDNTIVNSMFFLYKIPFSMVNYIFRAYYSIPFSIRMESNRKHTESIYIVLSIVALISTGRIKAVFTACALSVSTNLIMVALLLLVQRRLFHLTQRRFECSMHFENKTEPVPCLTQTHLLNMNFLVIL